MAEAMAELLRIKAKLARRAAQEARHYVGDGVNAWLTAQTAFFTARQTKKSNTIGLRPKSSRNLPTSKGRTGFAYTVANSCGLNLGSNAKPVMVSSVKPASPRNATTKN